VCLQPAGYSLLMVKQTVDLFDSQNHIPIA
jgi:hypothetical protein